MNRTDRIRELLTRAFAPVSLEVIDDSARHAGHAAAREHGGGHFVVRITATAFAGQPRIRRHRMVHEALAEMFPAEIHALSVDARTPGE